MIIYDNLHKIKDTRYCYEVEINKKYEINGLMNIKIFIESENYILKNNEIELEYQKLRHEKLFLRNYKIGDRIALYRDGRKKKISDFFTDIKLNREIRKKVPVLCTEEKVIAIIGIRVSEIYKAEKNSKKLIVKYENL